MQNTGQQTVNNSVQTNNHVNSGGNNGNSIQNQNNAAGRAAPIKATESVLLTLLWGCLNYQKMTITEYAAINPIQMVGNLGVEANNNQALVSNITSTHGNNNGNSNSSLRLFQQPPSNPSQNNLVINNRHNDDEKEEVAPEGPGGTPYL